jgi:hypothetical protein
MSIRCLFVVRGVNELNSSNILQLGSGSFYTMSSMFGSNLVRDLVLRLGSFYRRLGLPTRPVNF